MPGKQNDLRYHVLIWASRGNIGAARTIDAATDGALSIVSFMELIQGARSKLEARQIRQSLRWLQFRILPLSEGFWRPRRRPH